MKDRALALVDMLKSASGGALLASGAMADAVAKAFPFTTAEDSAIGEVVAYRFSRSNHLFMNLPKFVGVLRMRSVN